MIIHRISACLVEKLSSFLSFPADPHEEKLTFILGPQDFYWLHMQAAKPQEISI